MGASERENKFSENFRKIYERKLSVKDKLQQIVNAGYKVQIRTRWTDNAWDVWIYQTNRKVIQKERSVFVWHEDLETAIDTAITKIEEV